MAVLYTNNATTTLAASITNVATTLTVATGTGALFPAITTPDYFYATLVDSSNNIEIVKVTARSSDTFTITRAQESTTARAYASGDKVELRVTAAGLANKLDKDTGGTLSGALALPANGLNVGSGQLAVSGGNVSASGNLSVTGTTTLTGDLTANGNTTLGNASTDTVTINGTAVSAPNGLTITGATTFNTNTTLVNNAPLYLKDTSGTNGSLVAQSDNNLVFYSTGSTGAQRAIWSISMRSDTSVFQINTGLRLDGTFNSIVTAVSASTIDCNAGIVFTKTAAGALTWTFSNAPAGRAFSFILELTNGGTGTQTWPTSVKWPGGSAPTLTSSGVDLLGFITDDGGTTWRGVQLMKDSK